MHSRITIAAALGLALTLSAARSDPFAGRVAGPPAQCVDTSTTMSGPVIADKDMIIVRAGPASGVPRCAASAQGFSRSTRC